MASSDAPTVDTGDDLLHFPTSDSFEPSAMPVHMYPFSPTLTGRSKRIQVKTACTKCQKSCKKCDQARPCLRCVKYGFGPEECVDSQRKERAKGKKRGPYKKRDRKGEAPSQELSQEIPLNTWPPPSGPSVGSIPPGYAPGFYAQFPPPVGLYYPPFYVVPGPAQPNPVQQDGGYAEQRPVG
ncbi:hypothetical protein B0H14DRAFT_2665927 [Mycena olivaceomarginata]|nr:hypothetical protein B0H14DRAFT_2665927 [Mycena olivaceomarginata]